MSNTQLETAFGSLALQRRPRRRNEVLQAWDAADRYLLNTLAESPPAPGSRLLLVNDQFGALAAALADYDCISWSDSAVAHLATADNCSANQRRTPQILSSCERPGGDFAAVLYRLPRNHSYMRFQLQQIAALLDGPETFLAATMAKYLDAPTMAVFSNSIGEAAASLAWKKARLIRLQQLHGEPEIDDDWLSFQCPELEISLGNRANVFSRA